MARVAIIAGVGLSIGLGTPLATPGISVGANGCDAARVCIFDENNFIDRMGSGAAGGGRVNVSDANNDRTDSWDNNTGTNAAWYYNFTYENADNCRNMPARSEDPNLGVFNSDELSSWRTDRGC